MEIVKIIVMFLMQSMTDAKGKPSSHRILALIFGVTFSFVWAFISITTGQLASIKEISEVALAGLSLASVLIGKFFELKALTGGSTVPPVQ